MEKKARMDAVSFDRGMVLLLGGLPGTGKPGSIRRTEPLQNSAEEIVQ